MSYLITIHSHQRQAGANVQSHQLLFMDNQPFLHMNVSREGECTLTGTAICKFLYFCNIIMPVCPEGWKQTKRYQSFSNVLQILKLQQSVQHAMCGMSIYGYFTIFSPPYLYDMSRIVNPKMLKMRLRDSRSACFKIFTDKKI